MFMNFFEIPWEEIGVFKECINPSLIKNYGSLKGGNSMALKDSNVMVRIPEELLPLLNDLGHGKSVDENVRISLAISFFVGKTVSLAKASEIAGLSLNDFIYILKTKNIPWSEYAESDFLRDSVTIRELVKESGD